MITNSSDNINGNKMKTGDKSESHNVIFVSSRGATFTVEISLFATGYELLELIQPLFKCIPFLMIGQRPIDRNLTLKFQGIKYGDTIIANDTLKYTNYEMDSQSLAPSRHTNHSESLLNMVLLTNDRIMDSIITNKACQIESLLALFDNGIYGKKNNESLEKQKGFDSATETIIPIGSEKASCEPLPPLFQTVLMPSAVAVGQQNNSAWYW